MEAPIDESIIIFHSCSSNLDVKRSDGSNCYEKHIGNTPRSIMTKGTSTRRKNRLPGMLYGNFDPGDQDKLMITYERDPEHDYTLNGACGVVYQGNIHFFGGEAARTTTQLTHSTKSEDYDFRRQHFFIETQRKGRIVKMTKMKNLDIGFHGPSCSTFEMSSKNIVILCFPSSRQKSCYSFDGKINYIGDSLYDHGMAMCGGNGLAKYKSNLIIVGGTDMKTEIMGKNINGNYIWSEAESDARFNKYMESIHGVHIMYMTGHSLVTIPSSDIHEEYVLHIGGANFLKCVKNKTLIAPRKIQKLDKSDSVFCWSPKGVKLSPRFL